MAEAKGPEDTAAPPLPGVDPAPVVVVEIAEDLKKELAAASDPLPNPSPVTKGQIGTSQSKPDVMISAAGNPVAVPTTTEEEDRATVGQRRINLIWETTQAAVALSVTIATLIVAARMALADEPDSAAFLLLSNVFFLVVGTYFHRTNNTATGGVGKGYQGR